MYIINNMCYKLVKLIDLSGEETSIYSVFIEEEQQTLYDIFLKENIDSFKDEVIDINERLKTIGTLTGARYSYFKHEEGAFGDLVCALYDNPDKNLRLYCIRYGTACVILGGGGHKPKSIKAFQENEKLTNENYLLRAISNAIYQKMRDGDIKLINDGMDFEGDLTLNTDKFDEK